MTNEVMRSPWAKYPASRAAKSLLLMPQCTHCVPPPGRHTAAIAPFSIASEVTRSPWPK
jgi:hypothetical protein